MTIKAVPIRLCIRAERASPRRAPSGLWAGERRAGVALARVAALSFSYSLWFEYPVWVQRRPPCCASRALRCDCRGWERSTNRAPGLGRGHVAVNLDLNGLPGSSLQLPPPPPPPRSARFLSQPTDQRRGPEWPPQAPGDAAAAPERYRATAAAAMQCSRMSKAPKPKLFLLFRSDAGTRPYVCGGAPAAAISLHRTPARGRQRKARRAAVLELAARQPARAPPTAAHPPVPASFAVPASPALPGALLVHAHTLGCYHISCNVTAWPGPRPRRPSLLFRLEVPHERAGRLLSRTRGGPAGRVEPKVIARPLGVPAQPGLGWQHDRRQAAIWLLNARPPCQLRKPLPWRPSCTATPSNQPHLAGGPCGPSGRSRRAPRA
jgi:hypothetical protein